MATQTIAYTDKVFLNENSSIADINKIKDVDMNEIKSVVNNNASETDTNTANITNITGTILWENDDPTQGISSATQITLSSSDYDMYEVLFYGSTSGTTSFSTGRILKGKSTSITFPYYSNGVQLRKRDITYNSDTSFTIGAPSGSDNANTVAIPVYVIGYKTGLFS